MYKKILFYLMLVSSLLRGTSLLLFNLSGVSHLPMIATLLSAGLAVLGGALVLRTLRHGIRLKELTIFHLSEIAVTCICFWALYLSPQDVSILETLITGNILTILLDATFLVLAYRKKRYISVSSLQKRTVRTLDRKKHQHKHPPKHHRSHKEKHSAKQQPATTPQPEQEPETPPQPKQESPTTPQPKQESPTTPQPKQEPETPPQPKQESPTTPQPEQESPTTPQPKQEPETPLSQEKHPQKHPRKKKRKSKRR